MGDDVDKETAAGAMLGTTKKIVLGGAIAGSAIVAFTTFWRVCSREQHSSRKRNFAELIPNAIDVSAKAFKQAYAAVDSGASDSGIAPQSMPTLSASAPEQDAELMTPKQGYAYGANAERQQWFVAQWVDTTELSVRVEYLSTMDGNASSLALPSQKKTTILKCFVREDAPSDPFELPSLEQR